MATNRADTLDPALLRPGRLDRKIEFPTPDRRQKRLIFQVCTAKMNLSDEVDLEDYVSRPDKLSAADIAAICQAAGLAAVRKNRYVVLPEDFENGYKAQCKKDAEKFEFYQVRCGRAARLRVRTSTMRWRSSLAHVIARLTQPPPRARARAPDCALSRSNCVIRSGGTRNIRPSHRPPVAARLPPARRPGGDAMMHYNYDIYRAPTCREPQFLLSLLASVLRRRAWSLMKPAASA